jgi:hypothetical protein
LKSTALLKLRPKEEDKIVIGLGLRLRQHCPFLTSDFCQKGFFEKELIKTKEIPINAESHLFKM